MEIPELGEGFLLASLLEPGLGSYLYRAPLLPKRINQGRHNKPLDVLPRGVVGAQLVAFPGIQSSLK